jgi:hypothetical protein
MILRMNTYCSLIVNRYLFDTLHSLLVSLESSLSYYFNTIILLKLSHTVPVTVTVTVPCILSQLADRLID